MTKAQQVERYVALLRVPLRLADWAITIKLTAYQSERAACVAQPEYKEATLYFNLRRIPKTQLFAYVLHEMLHMHVWRLAAVGERLAENPKDLEAVRWEEEALTVELERILEPLLQPGG